MRVGLVCPYEWSLPGGVQTQVAGLARSLGLMGVAVTVIAPHASGGGGGDGRVPRGRASVGCRPMTAVSRTCSFGLGGASACRRTARSRRWPRRRRRWRERCAPSGALAPDVVHVHEPLTPGPSLAAMIAGPSPIVATFHRSGLDRMYAAESLLLGGLMARAAHIVAVSGAAAETARAAFGRHLDGRELVIVPNGVELGPYAGAREEAARSRATARNEVPTIAFVGRHEERKGLRTLLEAFRELPAEVFLDVLGDGPSSAELRRQFPDARIRWLGTVSDEEKARRLAAAELFVAPSIERESFGVVLLEAMAAGTAVVASDLPGYRLAAGEAARFVPPGDHRLLAGALMALLSDAGERQRLVLLGAAVAAAHSMETIAGLYTDLYRSARRPGPSCRGDRARSRRS